MDVDMSSADEVAGTNGAAVLPKGTPVQFFYGAHAADGRPLVGVLPTSRKAPPALLKSHGWLEGTLEVDFNWAAFKPDSQNTWAIVSPQRDIPFVYYEGKGQAVDYAPRRVRWIRAPTREPTLLSVVFARWGNVSDAWMTEEGGWGNYGSSVSNEYMAHLTDLGILQHPMLCSFPGGVPGNVEVWALFIKGAEDLHRVEKGASEICTRIRQNGAKKASCFWMLYPCEWEEDPSDDTFATYVKRHSLFNAMRAMEAAGVSSGFPHNADLYELITSKSWMCTLSLWPEARLPAATMVTKGVVQNDPRKAAAQALRALEHIRAANPFVTLPGEPAQPSELNKDGFKKGVVKIGWSWENRFVLSFNGFNDLERRLKEILFQPGSTASSCIVQEWVDFDFEMRLYMFPPLEWKAEEMLQPEQIECNAWGERRENSGLGQCQSAFIEISHDQAKKRWENDEACWTDAKAKTTELANRLVRWLLAANARPVPKIRMDFMVRRVAPGRAVVYFGEFCEMGACCLKWKEGPPRIWRAALDSVLR